MTDSYKTISGTASAVYEEKKSRFIAQVAPVDSEEEALAFLESVRSDHPMARHNVYAYVLREGNRIRYSDDGEPAKTSGLPTLSVIEHEELTNAICVTTRYFGGVLLGTGGLVRAYTKAAQDAFALAQKVLYAYCIDLKVTLAYPLYDTLKHWIARHNLQTIASDFSHEVTITLRVRAAEADAVKAALVETAHGQARIQVGTASFQPLDLNE